MWKILLVLSLIAADQISKFLIFKNLSIGESLNLLPVLDLYLVLNTGIAFSWFDDGGSFGRWILVLLVFLVCIYLVYILLTEVLNRFESLAFLLILSGGIGNLIDRSLRGYVIDFIYLYYDNYSFYVFNFADTFITVGVIVYLFGIVFLKLRSNGNKTS
tara:strand:- start:415 stop:891 length:477 start_codon:yes stop_codon:yes gene_type:complete